MTNEAKTEQPQQLSASELAEAIVSTTPEEYVRIMVNTLKAVGEEAPQQPFNRAAVALEQEFIKQYGCSMYDPFPFTQVAGVH